MNISHPWQRRARTRAGLGGDAEPEMRPADLGSGQRGDRDDRRLRGSGHRRWRRGCHLCRGKQHRLRDRRPRSAFGRRGRGPVARCGSSGLRPVCRGGAVGGFQELHQGNLRRRQRADRGLRAFHRCGCGQSLCPRTGRADRGEGGWSGRRQGRDHRGNRGRGGSRHRRHVRRCLWRGRGRGGDRGIHAGARQRRSLSCAMAPTSCPSAPRRTTNAWARAIPASTPGAWGPIRPHQC